MTWLLLATILPAAVISWCTCALVLRYAVTIGLVDEPGHRKVHTRTTPLGGGLGIWLGVLLPFAAGHLVLVWLGQADSPRAAWQSATAWAGIPMLPDMAFIHLDGLIQQMPKLWMLLAGGTILMVLGLLDDLKGLNWKLRIGIQFAVAAAIVASGVRATFYVEAAWVTLLVSTLWIVGLVNSFNMLDNMDCLSGGVAAIAAAVLAAILLLSPNPVLHRPQLFVAGYLLVLIGALLGFLWHNRPPARLFMGDAGSYFVGYSLASMTILATFTGGSLPPHAVLVPLCVLAVPLYDTITVVMIRLRAGRSPFEGDKSHFSHRLVELGMTKVQAVLTIYLTTATCGLCAFLLNQVNLAGAVIIVLVVFCMLCLVGILETVGRRKS